MVGLEWRYHHHYQQEQEQEQQSLLLQVPSVLLQASS
jgi:hypothetical protein